MKHWRISIALAFAVIVPAVIALARADNAVLSAQQKNHRLEREQEALVQKLKRDVQAMEDSPRKEEFITKIAEMERRIREPQDLYVSPTSKFTPSMATYYQSMRRRLEDCGTRHFPIRDGIKLHGTAFAAITLNRSGALIASEVLESSGDPLIDLQVAKIVVASAPFGAAPSDVIRNRPGLYRHLVVLQRFTFLRNDKPLPEDIPESERCRWP